MVDGLDNMILFLLQLFLGMLRVCIPGGSRRFEGLLLTPVPVMNRRTRWNASPLFERVPAYVSLSGASLPEKVPAEPYNRLHQTEGTARFSILSGSDPVNRR